MYTTEKRQKESVPIHLFSKRRDARQRGTEACANFYLSRLEYRQVVDRKFFVWHQNFDEEYFYQNKRNGAFLLKCGVVSTLN